MTEQTIAPAEVLAVMETNAKDARRWRLSEWTSVDAEASTEVSNRALAAVAALIAREAAYRNALEHIAGSCEGRAAEVASAALKDAEAGSDA